MSIRKAINAKIIESPTVTQELQRKLAIAEKLVDEVLSLNPNVGELGAGKCLYMQDLAHEFKGHFRGRL